MQRSRFTDQQIAFALQQGEHGTQVAEVTRKMGVSEQIFYRWKKKFGGLMPAEVRKLRQPGLSIAGGVSLGGAAPESPEFNALGESGGAGNRTAEPIRLCPSFIHPPRRSSGSQAEPYPPGGQANISRSLKVEKAKFSHSKWSKKKGQVQPNCSQVLSLPASRGDGQLTRPGCREATNQAGSKAGSFMRLNSPLPSSGWCALLPPPRPSGRWGWQR